LAMGSRTPVPLPLGRLRAQGRVLEIDARRLSFGVAEASELFDALGVRLPADAVADVVERSEGWPVSLYLAGLAASTRHRAEAEVAVDVVGRFDGDHRFLAEYVRDELLPDLDSDTARFLAEASCFDQMSGPECDSVLGRVGSARELDELARRSMLVVPMDDQRRTYRFHHLMRSYLAAELARQ